MSEKDPTLFETIKILGGMVAKSFARKTPKERIKEFKDFNIDDEGISAKIESFGSDIDDFINDHMTGGSISINGKKYSGKSVSINCNRITVDGKLINVDEKVITIVVNGNIDRLHVDACESVQVTGSAGRVETMSGDVTCGAVTGSVKTMSGSVYCTTVGGDVETMSGSISRR